MLAIQHREGNAALTVEYRPVGAILRCDILPLGVRIAVIPPCKGVALLGDCLYRGCRIALGHHLQEIPNHTSSNASLVDNVDRWGKARRYIQICLHILILTHLLSLTIAPALKHVVLEFPPLPFRILNILCAGLLGFCHHGSPVFTLHHFLQRHTLYTPVLIGSVE